MPSYYDPFNEMISLSDAMNRMLQDSFVLPRTGSSRGGLTQFRPRMDVQETPEDYVVRLNLPGWKPNDVDVMINGNTLTVRGHESHQTTEPHQGQGTQTGQMTQGSQTGQTHQGSQSGQTSQGNQQRAQGTSSQHPQSFYHLRERDVTDFERSFTFPSDVNADKANAEFEDGVLTLTVPKAEAAKARKIQIGGQPNQQQISQGQSQGTR